MWSAFWLEKGHCYRLNHLNQYKTETACIHVPPVDGSAPRKWPIPSRWEGEDVGTIMCDAACPLLTRAMPMAQCSLQFIFLECAAEKNYD